MTGSKGKAKWEKQAEEAALPVAESMDVFTSFESVEEWEGTTLTFNQMLERKAHLDTELVALEAEKKWIGDQLLLVLAMSECEKVQTHVGILKVGHGTSPSKIEPTKLLEQGVSVEQIRAATVEGNPYTFAQILKPKADSNGHA